MVSRAYAQQKSNVNELVALLLGAAAEHLLNRDFLLEEQDLERSCRVTDRGAVGSRRSRCGLCLNAQGSEFDSCVRWGVEEEVCDRF